MSILAAQVPALPLKPIWEPSAAEEAAEVAELFSAPMEDYWEDARLRDCIQYLRRGSLELPAFWPADF